MPDQGPEIVIALAGAVGTDLHAVCASLISALQAVRYSATEIRLSSCIRETVGTQPPVPEHPRDVYLDEMIRAGDDLRQGTARNDVVALLGVAKIKEERNRAVDPSLLEVEGERPLDRRAFIIRSLKHPEEARALRQIYGVNFYLLAAYSPRSRRRGALARDIGADHGHSSDPDGANAERLIETDRLEPDKSHGQNLEGTFHLADCFVDASAETASIDRDLNRFVQLAFGNPFLTPTIAEYDMFHAQAAALRSSEPGRQVGAAIADQDGNIIAVGTNEIPKAGGGLRWCDGSLDLKLPVPSRDPSEIYKEELLVEVLQHLAGAGWLTEDRRGRSPLELAREAISGDKPVIPKAARVRNLIEFGSAVHAEMAAIDDAARRGTPVAGRTMYVTTFPCHLCARHILASGVARVRYIEPYPRSLATALYPDAIVVEPTSPIGAHQVAFEPFLGIAPRQYFRLFTAPQRKDKEGKIVEFDPHESIPRGTPPEPLYLKREDAQIVKLQEALKNYRKQEP